MHTDTTQIETWYIVLIEREREREREEKRVFGDSVFSRGKNYEH